MAAAKPFPNPNLCKSLAMMDHLDGQSLNLPTLPHKDSRYSQFFVIFGSVRFSRVSLSGAVEGDQ